MAGLQPNRRWKRIGALSCAMVWMAMMSVVSVTDVTAKTAHPALKVFIVHSYEDDHVCGVPQGQGIEQMLHARQGNAVTVKRHFMNTKTTNSTPERMQIEGARVLHAIAKFNPDIVFTVDDNAFREVGLKLVGKPYPVIFSGLNGQPGTYNQRVPFLDGSGQPSQNISGVYEKLHFETAINVMQGVNPGLTKVMALLDQSPTGRAIRVQIEKEVAQSNMDVEILYQHVGTLAAFRDAIAQINADDSIQAVYPVVLTVENGSQGRVGFKTTLKEFIERSQKPGLALNFAFARLGLFGGASVDFAAMGRQAGEMGLQLLQGRAINDLPIQSAQAYLITFNLSRAKMLGVDVPDELIGASIIYDQMALLAQSQ